VTEVQNPDRIVRNLDGFDLNLIKLIQNNQYFQESKENPIKPIGGTVFVNILHMARTPRHFIVQDSSLFHVTWKCHNNSWLLKERWAKQLFYDLLLKYKFDYRIIFFSYMFMDNHIHLSGQIPTLEEFSAFFRVVNSMFAREVNRRLKRCGQVVRDRFRSPQIQNEGELLHTMVYHDLNEVRCGKANDPRTAKFSSYAHYAFGKKDPLITEPELYKNLGKTPKERQAAYRERVLEILVAAPRKRNGMYTDKLFIGDPIWVEQKYEELKSLRIVLKKYKKIRSHSPPLQKTR